MTEHHMRSMTILPLHHGRAPKWLFKRMVRLAECIVELLIHEYGVEGLLQRLSDPWFFQSLSCVLGYDWHSSGTTTVTCGALKEAIKAEKFGVAVAGGKGKTSRKTPNHIEEYGTTLGLSTYQIEKLKYNSRMVAKVDNSLIQDGYDIYHHTFVFDEEGKWIVIQQGINEEKGNARRYQWSYTERSIIEEPPKTILCDTRLLKVLDITSTKSEGNRKGSLELAKEDPRKLKKKIIAPSSITQSNLDSWIGIEQYYKVLEMPVKINWKAITKIYEFQPKNYEELVSLRGVGSSTLRGLSLLSELIYGEKASWSDPVRYSFAFGGKDGVPFPVDRSAMDDSVDLLKTALNSVPLKRGQRLRAFKLLRGVVPSIPEGRLRDLGFQ